MPRVSGYGTERSGELTAMRAHIMLRERLDRPLARGNCDARFRELVGRYGGKSLNR
ncbi:hypothetical protein BURKHO8Y_40071 [Burkholderia sp. 8Y]|nr:hypothetical protein BURKHO8Y_40071 [Burkholderia sp. 8Y]